ncbi:hypothetical protein GH714_026525 [Hevea brasiliensis]|uniref:Defective in cullin neddylation protein n=1 Tax=Hevea brasiliensis TaxID=3981 RepID=A0A6A6M808_HEVBR|nr:hypothetical protein GH714_026525 [Hevea brasiliensis]
MNPSNLKFSKRSKKKFHEEEEDGATMSMPSANVQALRGRDWHLDGAFDVFYNQAHIKTFTDSRNLEKLYSRYKGKLPLQLIFCRLVNRLVFTVTVRPMLLHFKYWAMYPYVDMILVDGITLLCNDLQVDPQDIVMLVVSWHMKAATMCEFSKQEFIGGLRALGIDSLEKFRETMPFMRSELKDEQKFVRSTTLLLVGQKKRLHVLMPFLLPNYFRTRSTSCLE